MSESICISYIKPSDSSTSILFCFWIHFIHLIGCFVFQVCEYKEQLDKHQVLSRSSSEPSQPTYQSTHSPDHTAEIERCHIGEHTQNCSQTNTDTQAKDDAPTAEVTQDMPIGRDTVIKDKTLIMHVGNDKKAQSLEDKQSNKTKHTYMEPVERDGKNTDTFRWATMHAICYSDS